MIPEARAAIVLSFAAAVGVASHCAWDELGADAASRRAAQPRMVVFEAFSSPG